MPLIDVIKTRLGFGPPPAPTDGGPFRLGPAAERVAAALPPGRALHVDAVPIAGGYALHGHVGESDDSGARLILGEIVRTRLRGIVLDHDGDRYVARAVLTVTPRDTPNPEGRKYETTRWLAEGPPREFRAGDPDPQPLAARLLAIPGIVAVLFHRNAVTALRAPGTTWAPVDRAVEAAIHEHLLMGGPLVASPPATGLSDSELEAAVRAVIAETVLDKVHRDGGDLQLVSVIDGVVRLRLVGSCRSCPASVLTLQAGVRRALDEALPGRILRVEAVDPSEPTEP